MSDKINPASPALAERAGTLLTASVARLRKMEPGQRQRLSVVAAVALAVVAGLIWYGARTDWRTLYAGLDPEDARAMTAELTAAGISYDVSPDGAALRVPADQLDKARLATTAKGGPRSGRMGFELFDKPNWVGSDFDEHVNYQRALEGELEHTIATLSAVQSARVHLVLPHDSLFSEEQRSAKASVLLKLRHKDLSDDEADSIRNLVAAAVDDLSPENVVLVDADGHGQIGRTGATAQAEGHEQALTAKIIETLEPVAGAGNIRAAVNIEYDTGSADEVDENYDPNNVVTLSMQRSEQNSGNQPAAAGVPGTASNAPNVTPPLYPASASGSQSLKQESSTYAASKKVRHTVQGPGKVRRITAAILVNQMVDSSGNRTTWRPRSPEEMKYLAALAQAAVGYDATRGDVVSIEDLPFEQDGAAGKLSAMQRVSQVLGESAGLVRSLAVIAGIALVLFFFVQPITRSLVAPVGSARPSADSALPSAPAEPPALTAEQIVAEQHKQRAQSVFEQVSVHLNREPVQSSRLLQSWIHSE